GASAVVSALAVSGLDTTLFTFEGFLSATKKHRIDRLKYISDFKQTLIFYEAPHKLIRTLEDMLEILGDRRISLCHELTKIHESVMLTTVSKALEYYRDITVKGEFVLVVEGKTEEEETQISIEEAVEMVNNLIAEGIKRTEACKIVALKTGFHKSELYK
ncbi:MAG: 16S rRNA (cytidine(1402)-2'-O)-methyltransferase, partial [Oscillospiraceae bacterium]|nr:16S rRNA (cytidine(1402)-2'-O)-methyltransferase [Oscillospiraceae bacterium]